MERDRIRLTHRLAPLAMVIGLVLVCGGCGKQIPAPRTALEKEKYVVLPQFSWQPVPNATSYHLQVSEDAEFKVLLIDVSDLIGEQYTSQTPMHRDQPYYWRVRVTIGKDEGSWSLPSPFRVVLQLPQLVGPSGTIHTNRPMLTWRKPIGAGDYSVQVSNTRNFSILILDETGIRGTKMEIPADLEYGVLYYWRVRSHDGSDMSEWSPPMQFTPEYETPIPLHPAHEAKLMTLSPRFAWSLSTNATGYVLQVTDRATFDEPTSLEGLFFEVDVPLETSFEERKSAAYQYPGNLRVNTAYKWHVCATYSDGGRSAWGDVRTLRIPQPPADPYPTTIVESNAVMHEVNPVLSRDGDKLAFVVYQKAETDDPMRALQEERATPKEVWQRAVTYDALGRPLLAQGRIKVTTSVMRTCDLHPTWSPDGRQVAFASNRMGGGDDVYSLCRKSLDAPGITMLWRCEGHEVAHHPEWSHASDRICFSIDDERMGAEYVWVVNPGGANATILVPGRFPAWSPDGELIAFASNRDGVWNIYTMTSAGADVTRLSNNSDADVLFRHPRWSNSGKWIAFSSNLGGNMDIYTLDLSTGQMQQITASLAADDEPRWLPKDRGLIFQSSRGAGDWNLWYSLLPEATYGE